MMIPTSAQSSTNRRPPEKPLKLKNLPRMTIAAGRVAVVAAVAAVVVETVRHGAGPRENAPSAAIQMTSLTSCRKRIATTQAVTKVIVRAPPRAKMARSPAVAGFVAAAAAEDPTRRAKQATQRQLAPLPMDALPCGNETKKMTTSMTMMTTTKCPSQNRLAVHARMTTTMMTMMIRRASRIRTFRPGPKRSA
jgi:hypothetical protein